MPAVLFGSISTLVDTSEIQRESFNRAFAHHGLDWRWDRDDYRAMLRGNGGAERIAQHAQSAGVSVDAAAVHRTKSELFQKAIADADDLAPRPGVVEVLRDARAAGLGTGLVTTTSSENVAALLVALEGRVDKAAFDVIVDVTQVERPKPDPAAYLEALRHLGVEPTAAVAVEDNVGGTESASAAGVVCVAFPNENTAGHDFPAALRRVDRLDLDTLRGLISQA